MRVLDSPPFPSAPPNTHTEKIVLFLLCVIVTSHLVAGTYTLTPGIRPEQG